MTPMVLLFGVGGMLVTAGIVAGVLAVLYQADPDAPKRRGAGVSVPKARLVHGLAAAAGVLVLALTGWPVAAIATALAVWFIPSVIGGAKKSEAQIIRMEAVAAWTRRLADMLRSGAASSLDTALRRSVGTVPAPIATEVQALVTRMGPQGMERALRAFAREVNDPAGDLVAAVLILRSRHGGAGMADVLTQLAADLDDRVRMTREVEAERAKPRATTRIIVLVTAAVIGGMILLVRPFLAPYGTLLGQVALAGIGVVFAFALRWLRQLNRPDPGYRFLETAADSSAALAQAGATT